MLLLLGGLCSCTSKLQVGNVAYRSLRLANPKSPDERQNAEIITVYTIEEGENKTEDKSKKNYVLHVQITNNTDNVMLIDQTKSFYINPGGKSICYFDPSVTTSTQTAMNSSGNQVGVNLGSIAGALGIGGTIGGLLGGVNVGGSSNNGQSNSTTVYNADLPAITIGPKGTAFLDKKFEVDDKSWVIENLPEFIISEPENSPFGFSVSISYSVDGGESFKLLTSKIYANSTICIPVKSKSQTNEAVRTILLNKPDAVHEPIWYIGMGNMMPDVGISLPFNLMDLDLSNFYLHGSITDFQ